MSNKKKHKALLGSGLLLAVTSSLCCIAPLLTILGGASGAVSAFSWAAPLRPYLLGATVLVIGFSFYQAYKPRQKDECGCEEKKSLIKSKTFLWIVAVVSFLLSVFPYYAKHLQPKAPERRQMVANNSSSLQQAIFHIQGMSCDACEGHVNNALLQRKGVQQVNTSYPKGLSTVKFDSTQISFQQLVNVIEDETGYKVVNK